MIEKGVQVSHIENWKGRGYDSYVFAGGAIIDGVPTIVGVIVNKDRNSGRYYMHAVFDENGEYIYKIKDSDGAYTRSEQKARNTGTPSESNSIIPNPAQNVNSDLSTGFGENGEYLLPGETGTAEYELPSEAQTQEARTQAAETEYQMPGEVAGEYLLPEDLAPEPRPQPAAPERTRTAQPGVTATADGMRPDIVKNLPAAAAYTAKNADILDHAVRQAERLVFGTFTIPQSEKADVRTELKTG